MAGWIDNTLKDLAEGNETREQVLANRQARRIARTRALTCPTCLEHGYTNRGKEDVCNQCLATMWKTQDTNKETSHLFTAFTRASRSHWYKTIFFGANTDVPETASFARTQGDTFDRSPHRTYEKLFFEFVEAMYEACPAHPTSFDGNAKTLMPDDGSGGYGGRNEIGFLMPTKAATALVDMIGFFQWATYQAHRDGYMEGTSALTALNSGDATFEQFNERNVEAAKRTQRKLNDLVNASI